MGSQINSAIVVHMIPTEMASYYLTTVFETLSYIHSLLPLKLSIGEIHMDKIVMDLNNSS